ncbi:unnamed protein product [Parascedosporium putredinis]|uniref:Uncharacterized protein n=1 Tax=Parascedosporium putredinis TaxID=1442378 RepID=A0A9P1GX20_9PEZI|nr:unnamed protein product [Parascedosporium putredinis]CAI7989374.1 unnamed protein product [Parascedosporium putredinis]
MGAGSSTPAPEGRSAREGVLAGVIDAISSTIRTMDLPPAITDRAREGIRLSAGLRRHFLFNTGQDADDDVAATTLVMMAGLATKARQACNIRDYVTLLVEDTVLRLSMDLVGAFRTTDAALVTDVEKGLLVLLYYCHESNIKDSPDEAIGHLCKLAEKYGDIKDLDTRKEPLTETEVYLFWALAFLVANITASVPEANLTAESRTRLAAERGVQLNRLLTACEMLLSEGRLDQACFCLAFLRRMVAGEERAWWKSRAKRIAKELGRRRKVRQKWHEEFAAQAVREVVKAPDVPGTEGWEARTSISFSREDLRFDPDPMKGL